MQAVHTAGTSYDAVVVGSGPNGLAAAVTIARAGHRVLVLEAAERLGGGTRTAELTLPGYLHDVCSAIHPLGVVSPFFCEQPLAKYGLEWIHPDAPLAHPFADGRALIVERSVSDTAERLGIDGGAYRQLFEPLVANASRILADALGPLRFPRHPWALLRFGWRGRHSAQTLAQRWFRTDLVRGMFAGMAAHSVLPLDQLPTGAVGLMFCLTAHYRGWPLARGGSQQISDSLARYLADLGGEIATQHPVRTMTEVPDARVVLFDLTPRQVSRIAGQQLPVRYRRRLERFRYGPGVFKIDWALDGPIPWRAPECARAATVHVGGTFEEIAAAEQAAWSGRLPERPFVLLAQQSLFDETRAPAGKQTVWGYCHVPAGCDQDCTELIERQVERFAPGFRDRILARHVLSPAAMENYNANYHGGDITGGAMTLSQVIARPVLRRVPYATPNPRLYLCSSSTPPGAGVHGLCGWYAAQAALKRLQ